jgi:hypothetical protein
VKAKRESEDHPTLSYRFARWKYLMTIDNKHKHEVDHIAGDCTPYNSNLTGLNRVHMASSHVLAKFWQTETFTRQIIVWVP